MGGETKNEEEAGKPSQNLHIMNGGNDINSYAKNSSAQRKIGDSAKSLVQIAIAENLDMAAFSPASIFRIADLGCSVGPNTFFAVQNIVEAVENKVNGTSQSGKMNVPEFHVFFNDQVSNDFNTLFTLHAENASRGSGYYAAGVPGSFYGRLFPSSSLHFVYSSCAINYLSRVPEQVLDKNSLAWNKGKISYSNSTDEVVLAYSDQHARDMDKFWLARAREIVHGGLMAVLLPARHNRTLHSKCYFSRTFDTLGSCLEDMVIKGAIDEEKLDSFNLSVYFPSQDELEEGINRNGHFDIEKTECFPHPIVEDAQIGSHFITMHMRAAMEGRINEHFGIENLDELFNMFKHKVELGYSDITSNEAIDLFILLKRRSI